MIRGGYGIYYSLFERIGSEDQLSLNPPFLINKTLASNKASVMTPEVGFPANFLDPTTIDFNNLTSFHVRAMNQDDPTPMIQQWSLGVQRQIGNAWLAEVNYVGTRSTHLDVLSDFNQPTIVGNVSTGIAPYSNFGYVEYTSPLGAGKYNGLEATLSRRFTNGLSMRLAYTYSRSLDNTPEELEIELGRGAERAELCGVVRAERFRHSASRGAELRV